MGRLGVIDQKETSNSQQARFCFNYLFSVFLSPLLLPLSHSDSLNIIVRIGINIGEDWLELGHLSAKEQWMYISHSDGLGLRVRYRHSRSTAEICRDFLI